MKYKTLTIFLAITVFILNGCVNSKKWYITLNYTLEKMKNSQYEMRVYEIDDKNKDGKLIDTIEYDSQYPLSFFDKEKNTIYYSKNVKGRGQLFGKNVKTGKINQYTEDLFAINDIMKVDNNNLLLVANSANDSFSDAIRLYNLDLKEKKLTQISKQDDIIYTGVTQITGGKFIYASYPKSEFDYSMTHNDADVYEKHTGKSSVYNYDSKQNKSTKLFDEKNGIITSIVQNGNDCYYTRSKNISVPTELIHINIKENKKETLINNIKFDELVGFIDNKLIVRGVSGLDIYDLKNKNFDSYFEVKEKGALNNAHLILS